MHIGYVRVSTVDQDPALQIRAFKQDRYEQIHTDHAAGFIL